MYRNVFCEAIYIQLHGYCVEGALPLIQYSSEVDNIRTEVAVEINDLVQVEGAGLKLEVPRLTVEPGK